MFRVFFQTRKRVSAIGAPIAPRNDEKSVTVPFGPETFSH
jgi:hypothetical protein